MEDKIDIHNSEGQYDGMLRKLILDKVMIQKNKELILKFIWDCKAGKTVQGRAKKKIGKKRIMKYVWGLKPLSAWLGKPFDEVSQTEIEKIVYNLEENVYKKQNGGLLSDETKLDFKKILRKFYKWLGKPEMVEFMDMSIKVKEVPAITRDEAEDLVNSTPRKDLKAIIMVLFDGGARAEELLNVRIKDVTKKQYENSECYWINIRYSKTKGRNIPLPLCTKHLNDWLAIHPDPENQEAPLFPVKYSKLAHRIPTLSKKVLNKNLTLHMLRHSSATYWATRMNRYQLCAKYGWSFGSDMPDRYIDRKGIIFDEIAKKGDEEQNNKLEKENQQLKGEVETMKTDQDKMKMVLEFLMPMMQGKEEDLKRVLFEKGKEKFTNAQPLDEGIKYN